VLFFLGLGVGSVLWACAYLEINQVKGILDRSDEVELLLARLHDANAELAAANTTLDAMRSDAAHELETRSVFFASASHDFRQRLHAMKLLAHSAINGASRSNGSSLRPLQRLADSVEDVEHYITNVLDFARFDRSSLNAERKTVELQQVFQQLDLGFEGVAAAKKVGLAVRTTGVVLLTDAAMLQRILENLLSNAIKFSSGRVLVGARRRDGGIAIEVWDQGRGIPAKALSEIFTPFYQTTIGLRGQDGVGLGLAVVKRLAHCLKYEVTVRSRVGRGTVVTVLVPAADVHVLDQGMV
jgi:signal transduction histidine kinase